VNGDGYADVIVGAPRWDGGQNEEGGVWVYHGAATGLTSAPAWHRQSNTTGAKFGYAVATAGDVNGDGYTDVIVGAPEWTNGQTDEGGVFVFHGSDSGLHSVTIDWYNEIDQVEAAFGHAVGTAGDVNGDGYADVIVGAPYWNHGQEDEGGAWVYHGSATGLTTDPAWSKESNQTNAAYGYAVGTAGDVNRDGYTDVIVGAPYWTDGHIFEGATWVYLGSSSGLNAIPNWYEQSEQTGSNLGYAVGTAGDVNGDGFADVIIGVPYWSNGQLQEGRALVYYGSSAGVWFSPWQKESDLTNARFGYSVGTAGDVNGDGYADVVVGAPYWTNGENYEGGAWVYHGAASGPHNVPDWHAVGGQEMAHYGWSVGTAGDVNSDGYAEVIVGAPDYNGTHVNEGQALVYFGNGGPGVSFRLRQRSGDNSLLAHLGKSNTPNSFRVNMRIASPFGRGKVRAEVEVKPLNTVFNGVNTHLGYSFTVGPGIDTVIPLSGLSGCMYHWRARWRYDPAVTPFQSYSRWVTIPWNGWNEQDLRTDCAGGVFLPLILRDSDGD
jgi:hypothetical protein